MGTPRGRNYAELAAKLAALEERTKTKQAQYETAIERLGKQLAEREIRLLLWMAAMLGMFTAILGLLIRLQAPLGCTVVPVALALLEGQDQRPYSEPVPVRCAPPG